MLGLLLFMAGQRLFPEPKPVLGPPNAERLAAMVENYARFAQGSVSPELLSRFVETELRDELLFRGLCCVNCSFAMRRLNSASSGTCASWMRNPRPLIKRFWSKATPSVCILRMR
ncbi:MAG: hypothetical protein CM15mP74_06910 [Halieaceae bacterium]|nr:MAG: hypothetical protein CM15mP74_06910 [Halieaceae bacterium]